MLALGSGSRPSRETGVLVALDVPLTLTDGTALHRGAWAFTAVAESTDNSYADGACVASAVGIVMPDGQVSQLYPLHGAPKVESLAVLAELQRDAGGH